MSPNGTLIAYSKPANIKQVRDQAALISLVLRDKLTPESDEAEQSLPDHLPEDFKALTIEVDSRTILARPLQSNLLLVLIGQTTNKLRRQMNVVLQYFGDPEYPDSKRNDANHGLGENDTKNPQFPDEFTSALQVQKRKINTLVDYIKSELNGFSQPNGTFMKPT